jgi:putative hydrolase of the HAD superfamily
MLPKAIFFDMDDTILNDNRASELAWQKACEISTHKTGLFDSQELFKRINVIRKQYWSDPKRDLPGDEARLNYNFSRKVIAKTALIESGYFRDDNTAVEIVDNYAQLKLESLELFPEAEMILETLQKRGTRLALLTNGEAIEQRSKIERMGIKKLFNFCFVEGELGHGKPDRKIFELALNRLQVEPLQAWMIGDDLHNDIKGAQQSGIFAVWCDYKHQGLPVASAVKPDRSIHNLIELLD